MKTQNNLDWEVVAVAYAVIIGKDNLLLILQNEIEHTGYLSISLEKNFNIYDIDYNPHFCGKIFFSVNDEDNTIDLREKVVMFIDEYITKLKG